MKNIRQIAELSGVSIATVSRYINNSGPVSKKTAKKIDMVIKENGYTPNKNVTEIFNKKTKTIGIIFQKINNPFFPEIIQTIESYASKNEYKIVLCNANNCQEEEEKHIKYFLERRVSGLIVINTTNPDLYKNIRIPLVGIERKIPGYSFVGTDNFKGGFLVGNHFLKSSFQKILFIGSNEYNTSSIEREQGFSYALKSIKYSKYTIDDNIIDINTLKIEEIKNFDSIFCWNDLVAHKVCTLLLKNNINIPNDIQVIGFDNLNINSLFPLNISTIHQDVLGMGTKSIESIFEQINDDNPLIKDHILDAYLLYNDTTRV